ncbi:MAG: phenylalanine--tRNA ligase subunit beta [Actinomycetales bacterium]|nr:phenylalanine--tRNA ligase subunit beta [Actinomycetales bacterium]
MPYVPLQWLADHVEVPPGTTVAQLAADLVRVGLEEESITPPTVTGDLVVGRVLSIAREKHKNGKTVNYCRVDVGAFNDPPGTGAEQAPVASRGVICGAHNFGVGDHVVVALPGAVLPGPFPITARKTYGHVSDGMICSERELGLGSDHSGIMVLERYLGGEVPPVGTNMIPVLGLGSELLEINITPDRGYCFSMRGVAREYSHSTGARFTDPVSRIHPPAPGEGGFPVEVRETGGVHGVVGCDRFVARVVRGVHPQAPSPAWMAERLRQAGMRPISLAVDVTNFVMLDLGQPMHAYDLGKVRAPLVVRRAVAGEELVTLDDVRRVLDPEDLLITDDDGRRVLALAGVMGGASTEIDAGTTDVLLEAAHFDPVTVARTARRHRIPSESAKRFERGVDPQLPPYAAQRAAELLVEYGGGRIEDVVTDVDTTVPPRPVVMDGQFPRRIIGVPYSTDDVAATLAMLGADVRRDGDTLTVTPPSWRTDLTIPEDLVEEVARLRGYDQIPSVVPCAPAGRGLTVRQRQRRAVVRALAEHGLNEVLSYPFVGDVHDRLGLPPDDPRRQMVRLANPIADDQPFLRTTLLATLLDVARRNVGRGNDLAVMEVGMVTEGREVSRSPLPPVGQLPAPETLAAIHGAVPRQPTHLAAVMAGPTAPGGALGRPRTWDWADAVELALLAGRTVGVAVGTTQAEYAPWHPGRCAALLVGGTVVGHAGELHPAVLPGLDLPPRSVAFELDLDAILDAVPADALQVSPVSTYPPAKEDIALVMDAGTPNGRALAVVRAAAAPLAEEVRLFDVYTSEALGPGVKSLAFSLRLRAADRTLSAAEIAGVRERVIAAAAAELGARLR